MDYQLPPIVNRSNSITSITTDNNNNNNHNQLPPIYSTGSPTSIKNIRGESNYHHQQQSSYDQSQSFDELANDEDDFILPPQASTSKSNSNSSKKQSTTTTGRKRKATGKNKNSNQNADDIGGGEEDGSKPKRVKNVRACDSCRGKKIRCDSIPDSDPPICAHCKSHNLSCTWFLPIQETRFKRRKALPNPVPDDLGASPSPSLANLPILQAAAIAGVSSLSPDNFSLQQQLHHQQIQIQQHQQQQQQQSQSQPHYSHPQSLAPTPPFFHQQHASHLSQSNGSSPDYLSSNGASGSAGGGGGHQAPRREARVIGPTSISHLMHSTSTFPTSKMAPVDTKYAQSLTVDETGDGFIRVISHGDTDLDRDGLESGGGAGGGAGNVQSGSAGGGSGQHQQQQQQSHPTAIQGIDRGDAEKLLNYYFSTHSEHFPIVSKADFIAGESPTPFLFNALCGISALSHHVSPSILRTIKGTIRATLREDDILDNSSIQNIQALLIYSHCGELEKNAAASKTWNSLGLAIRMAQDLGLHRQLGAERKGKGGTKEVESDADHTELRRRVWGGCVIADRWISAAYGQPMMIDLADCDCLLPSVFDIRPNSEQYDSERRPYLFNSALISLSILLGRITKLVYSPTGIMTLSSSDADALIEDLGSWTTDLPEELKFQGPIQSSSAAGFLNLLYIPVRFLVTRPFMRISFQLPERFANISVGIEQWSKLESEAREAIEWVDRNESCLEGWFVGLYSFFISALIQYHSHIRRRDARSLTTLRLARDIMRRLVVPDGECHVREKIAEITHLLYATACSVAKWAPDAGTEGNDSAITTLNPTAGVRQRQQDWNLKYKKANVHSAAYFITEKIASPHDPIGVRSSVSPATSGAPSPALYSSSLRSTHIDPEPEVDPGLNSLATQGVPLPLQLDSNGVNNNNSSALPKFNFTEPSTVGTSTVPGPGGVGVGGNSTFPDGMNFNPTFNLSNGLVGGYGNETFSNNLNNNNLNNSSSSTSFNFDGSPALFPNEIFDWENWSSYFSAVPGGGLGL